MHNFLRQSAYTDVYAGCGVATGGRSAVVIAADAESIGKLAPLCYFRNDSPWPFSGTVAVSLVSLASGKSKQLTVISAEIGGGGGTASVFCPNGEALLGSTASSATTCGNWTTLLSAVGCEPNTCYLDVRVEAGMSRDGLLYAHNEQLLAAPFQLQLPRIKLSVHVHTPAVASDNSSVAVEVKADNTGVAAFVWLSTLAEGRFEPNGFMLAEGSKTIEFVPFGTPSHELVGLLQASVRVEHLAEHLVLS